MVAKYVFLVLFLLFFSYKASPRALYRSLDPKSVAQHLALYELYPESPEGKRALQEAWTLMGGQEEIALEISSLEMGLQAIVGLVNKAPKEEAPLISEEDCALIEKVAGKLANRKLKGHYARRESEVLELAPEEVDLSRGLFLSQMGDSPEALARIKSYEAAIDLMALQIRARLGNEPSAAEKIAAINSFVFFEMGFRFPPHSLYSKDIDLYTFLPSVMDSRRGVCLGVCVLYLAIAQRLNLSLEMITPPGHIYVRHREGDRVINIETTARGISIDSEDYLGLDTLSLQERNSKETIGLTFVNQASVFMKQEKYEQALSYYEKAKLYLPEDLLVKELMGYCYIFTGNVQKGCSLLEETSRQPSIHSLHKESMALDYLSGATNAEGLQAVFLTVDENRSSLLVKQQRLQKHLAEYPHFKAGQFALASTWIQLNRYGEALESLERYHQLDPTDPKAEYYLSALYEMRYQTDKAWEHLCKAEKLTASKNHFPKALKELRRQLSLSH